MVEDQPDHNERSCDDDPSAEKVERTEPNKQNPKQQYDPLKWWPDWLPAHRVNAISTVFIAGFTGALLWTSAGQWTEMQASVKQTEQLVIISKEADRPWLGFIDGPTIEPSAKENMSVVRLIVQNSGKSPAKVLAFIVGAHIAPSNVPFSPQYAWTDDVFLGGKALLLPGRAAPSEYYVAMGKELEVLKTGMFNFYVYGDVFYEDLSTRKRHLTRTCFYRSGFREKALNAIDYIACPGDYAYAD